MSADQPEMDANFIQLILSLQAGAMQQMGKVASPLSGKVERDLNMAQATIDLLGMLETKTKGNLSEQEEQILKHILYELRLNYVDESKKSDPEPDDEKASEETSEDNSEPKSEDSGEGTDKAS